MCWNPWEKNSKQRIRDDYRKYNMVLRQKNRGKKQQRVILTMEQQRILNDDALHKNYLCGKQLANLEKKLQDAEKREDTEATKARSALAAATVLSSTATTTVDDSNAFDSPSVDRSIIPLVSSETEKKSNIFYHCQLCNFEQCDCSSYNYCQ